MPRRLSIQTRLQAVILVVTACTLAVADLAGLMVVHRWWMTERVGHLRVHLEYMARVLDLEDLSAAEVWLRHGMAVEADYVDARYAAVLGDDGVLVSWGTPPETPIPVREGRVVRGRRLQVAERLILPGGEAVTLLIQTDQKRFRARFRWIAIISAGVIGLGLALAGILAPRAVRPVMQPLDTMASRVRRLRPGGDGMERLEEVDDPALRELALCINGLLDRVEQLHGDNRNQLAFLRAILDSIPLPVYCKDRDFRYTAVNRAFCENVVRLPEEEVLGKTLAEVRPDIPPEEQAHYHRLDEELRDRPGEVQVYEGQVSDLDGQEREIRLTKSVFRDAAGQPAGIIGILEEFTRERAIEREVVDSIVAEQQRISRDLHNDLSQLITAAAYKVKLIELQHEGEDAGEARQRLREAVALINQAASRTRSLARELAPVEVDGDGVADALRVLAERTGSGRGFTCRFIEEGAITDLPRSTANQVYAIGLQMLQLAEHHARLTQAELRLACEGRELGLGLTFDGVLEDNDTPENRIWEKGLEVLRHRARLVGGKTVYTRNQECVNSLLCKIPLPLPPLQTADWT